MGGPVRIHAECRVLGDRFPSVSSLYAQKHNPFVYFKNIALDPDRLAKLKPFVLGSFRPNWLIPLGLKIYLPRPEPLPRPTRHTRLQSRRTYASAEMRISRRPYPQ